MIKNNKQHLFLIMEEAINSSKPNDNFPKLIEKPKGKIYVLGAGKAAGSMAKAFEDQCSFDLEGLVITRYDHFVKTKKIKVVEASHPIPDLNGHNATKKIMRIAKCTSKDDLVIFLISGGASALLCSPLDGINFDEKQIINKELLKSGASIDEMNIVRQSISAVKGGRLLELIKPSNCITYGISDIPGDDPSFIGSGPTIYSSNKPDRLFEILDKYRSKNGEPDCVVGLSGGRDSSYGLHLLKTKFKMSPIAFTYDWGLTTDTSRVNQAKLCGKLGIEHIIRSANIKQKRNYVRNNIMAWLKKPHLGMLPVVQAGDKPFMDYGDILAKEHKIKLVIQFTGYQLEQREFFLGFAGINQKLENNQRMSSYNLFNKLRMFYFYTTQTLLNPRYINLALLDNFQGFISSFVRKESSLHFYNYIKWDEKKIIDTLKQEYNWSNDLAYGKNQWRMGDGQTTFNNFIYYTLAGFSEFDNFRSNQVCEDLLNREEAVELAKKDNQFKYDVLKNFSEIIGFNLDDVLSKIVSLPKLY